jgi:hypothetical protein
MDNQTAKTKSKRNPITLVAGVFLAILYLALCGVVAIVGQEQLRKSANPTSTHLPIATPHVLAHMPSDPGKVIYEDFSSKPSNWGLYYFYGKLEIINGKLVLQSDMPNQLAVGTTKHLTPSGEKYYIQADFSTDTKTNFPYGLVFGLSKSLGTYYMFEILPLSTSFRLSKYSAGQWDQLVPPSPANLNPYPQANTLSVYFDHGKMELYVNGMLQSNYTDKDFFQSKDMGVFVSNIGYQLFVDDLFVFDEK